MQTGMVLREAQEQGGNILFEAQLGALRDLDFGICPYTTSSNTLAAYAPVGAGLPSAKIDEIIGVVTFANTHRCYVNQLMKRAGRKPDKTRWRKSMNNWRRLEHRLCECCNYWCSEITNLYTCSIDRTPDKIYGVLYFVRTSRNYCI